MKIFGILLGALIAVAQPVQAQEMKLLDKVPEEYLMKILSTVAVCIRADVNGSIKLLKIVKSMREDNPNMAEDDTKIIGSAISDINNINHVMEAETTIGVAVANTLMETYHHSEENLEAIIDPIAKSSDDGMEDLLKDVKTYEEFTNIFVPKMNKCSDMLHQMGRDVENFMENG